MYANRTGSLLATDRRANMLTPNKEQEASSEVLVKSDKTKNRTKRQLSLGATTDKTQQDQVRVLVFAMEQMNSSLIFA